MTLTGWYYHSVFSPYCTRFGKSLSLWLVILRVLDVSSTQKSPYSITDIINIIVVIVFGRRALPNAPE